LRGLSAQFYEMEDYFRFGCAYNLNESGSALNAHRCPWGGSDEGFPAGFAAEYVNSTLIPELIDLVQARPERFTQAQARATSVAV
jgi:hypothetical protein